MTAATTPRDPLRELYRKVVLEHYRHPRNRDPLPDPQATATVSNPVCGDQSRVQVRLADDCIAAVAAQTRGCSIAVAAGSVMTELVRARPLDEVAGLRRALEQLVSGEPAPRGLDERLRAFAGVAELPARRRCALLAWEALEEALEEARGGA